MDRQTTARRAASGLAAFPCGLCHSPIADEPASPYFMYLIAHPEGFVLFDAGLPSEHLVGVTAVVVDGVRYRIEADANCSALALLSAFGLAACDLAFLVLSHLHFDHAGGMSLLGGVQTLVQHEELTAAAEQPPGNPLWVRPRAEVAASRVLPLRGDHDVFADGSVVALSAPGHTPGHQCLFVRLEGGDCFMLGADIVYYPAEFRDRAIPDIAWNREASLATCERVAALMNDTGARLLLSHDPTYRSSVRVAPDRYYGTLAAQRARRDP